MGSIISAIDTILIYKNLLLCDGGNTTPTPTTNTVVETEWTSAGSWDNGNPRTLNVQQANAIVVDPDDPRLAVIKVGNPLPIATIDGQGMLTVEGGSPRIYYDGPWQNLEFGSDIRANSLVKEAYLIARSDHEIRPCGYGGNDLFFNFPEKKMYFKKEIHHDLCPTDGHKGYSPRMQEVPVDIQQEVWFNAMIRVKNIDNGTKVKLEGFFNGVKMNEVIDRGNIRCNNRRTPPYTTQCKWCYTRANSTQENTSLSISYKNMVIKPI